MASVPLRFLPPSDPDMAQLQIFESDAIDGNYNLIETVTEIGTYPDFITEYTTALASSLTNWFAIKWVDTKGAATDLSQPIQGGTSSLVADIASRVSLIDPTLNESVLLQQSEDVVAEYFHTDEPFSITPSEASHRIRSGLTFLVMARCLTLSLADTSQGWVAGLVSMKSSDTTQKLLAINEMIRQAERSLGLRHSIVAQMAIPEIAGGLSEIVSADISRLLIEVE